MKITHLAVCNGREVPKFYGTTYYDHNLGVMVCHIIPLNIVFRMGYWIWWWIKSYGAVRYWKGQSLMWMRQWNHERERAERAEKTLSEAQELVIRMRGYAE